MSRRSSNPTKDKEARVITGQALAVYKAALLRILNNWAGIEAREQQIVSDFQISQSPNARPDDVRQALGALKDDGLALRRQDDVRGPVWRVSPEGHKAAAKLAIEEEF